MSRLITVILIFIQSVVIAEASAFELKDSNPKSAEFKRQFLANYGVNSDIEPSLSPKDRPLYEKISPYLRDEPKRAIELVEDAISKDSNAAFYFLLGNLYYQMEDFDTAAENLDIAVSKFPAFRRAYRTLAIIALREDEYQRSVDNWLKVITLGGGDAQSYGLLAYSYLRLDKISSALSAYRMARMFKPDSEDFRRGHAQCLLLTQDYEKAITLFDELISEVPDEYDYWILQANAFMALERYNEAIANLELIKGAGYKKWESLILLGDLYLKQGMTRLAVDVYRDAIKAEIKIGFVAAFRPLDQLVNHRMFPEAGSYLELLKKASHVLKTDKDIIELRVIEARIEFETGNAEIAAKLVNPITDDYPLNGDALLLRADILKSQKDYVEAEFYLQRAISLSDYQVKALIELGRMKVEEGDLKSALRHLEKAQKLDFSKNVERYILSLKKALSRA